MDVTTTYLELLVPAGQRGLESTTGGRAGSIDSAERLERLRAEIAYVERRTGTKADPDEVAVVLADAERGLERLLGDGPDAELGPADLSGLEAVIKSDGSRPVLFVDDDFVDLMEPSIGTYGATLSLVADKVRSVCRAVGRVDDPQAGSGYQGTAWMVGDGLVVTNYHVLDAIAPGGVREDGRFTGQLNTGVAVHFGHEVDRRLPERRFPIRRVVGVGSAGAAEFALSGSSGVNFDGLDLAVLELEPVPGRAFPEPLHWARGDDPRTRGALANRGRDVYLVGYPGDRTYITADVFERLFRNILTYKRLAPGTITAAAGEVDGDPRKWILAHDVSTLGGCSGSAVVDLAGAGDTVLGLHFGGQNERQNWAHSLERTTSELSAIIASRS